MGIVIKYLVTVDWSLNDFAILQQKIAILTPF